MFSSNSKLPIGLSILSLTISSALAAKCVGQEGIGDPSSAEDTLSLNLEGIADAVTLFRSGRYGECRERLIAARATRPSLPPADTFLAVLHLSAGRTSAARAALDLAVINAPEDPEAYILLADIALRDGQRTFANLGYEKGQELLDEIGGFPKRRKALNLRILAGMSSLAEIRGQFEKAESYLKLWEREVPDSPVITGSLGRIYFQQQQYDMARETFAKLIELEPNSPPVEIVMGRLFGESGMREESSQEMAKAAKLYPDDIKVRLAVAARAIEIGNLELLKENVKAAKKLNPNALEVGVIEAKLFQLEGDFEKAEATASAVVLSNPNSFSAVDELAQVLADSENADKRKLALEYARRNYSAYGKTRSKAAVTAVITYAWALFRNDRSADAEVVLRSVPSGSTIGPQQTYYSGMIYLARGQKTAGINALSAALASDGLFSGRAACKVQLDKIRGQ